MTKTIHAIYENGVFRPIEPVNLPDHTAVEIELRVEEGTASRQPGEGFLRTEGRWPMILTGTASWKKSTKPESRSGPLSEEP